MSIQNGSWVMTTEGSGTNLYAGRITAPLNSGQGKQIFNALDQQARDYINEQYPGCNA